MKNQAQNETEIRQLISRWEKAARLMDIDGIMADHTSDMLAFDVTPPMRFRGIEEYRRQWESFFPIFTGDAIFEISELDVTAGEDVAFGACFIRCGGRKPDGETCEGTVRATLGFRKIDGRWHFSHEHHSMPVECPEMAEPNAQGARD